MASAEDIRILLRRLNGEPADAIESQTIECKSWDPSHSAREKQFKQLRETVVCFANARGGTIILGVADRTRTRSEAIRGVGDLRIADLRRQIYDGTEPHILVDIDELIEPEGRLLLVHVPRGIPPHTTSDGVIRIRVDKECKPVTGSELSRLLMSGGEHDLTAMALSGATLDDLDHERIAALQRTVAVESGRSDLARLRPDELLANLDLIRDGDVTLAAVLLVGRTSALARWVPQHEVAFMRFGRQTAYEVRRDLKGCLLSVLDTVRQLLEANLSFETVETRGFTQLEIPDLTWLSAREAVLNAVVHRDYFVRQSVQLELHRDRFVVSSPGGFIGGVTAQNILRHPPVRRNPLLAGALQSIGLVNRAGLGVDRICEDLLRLGKRMPVFDSDESHVRLTLPTRPDPAFARFVAAEIRQGRLLELDDLIALRAASDRGSLNRWLAAEWLQLPEGQAAERLISLRARGYLVARGRGRGTEYLLAREFSDLLRGPRETDHDFALDQEAVKLRAQTILAERGRITNEDVRRLSGFSRRAATRLLQTLVEEGSAELQSRGRGAHYVPGPRLRSDARDRPPKK